MGVRADFERKRVDSLSGAVEEDPPPPPLPLPDDDVADILLITIGWQISVIGLRSAVDGVKERHLAISKLRSGRWVDDDVDVVVVVVAAAAPASPAANGNGTKRCNTWNLCSSRYFFEQKHR